MSTSGGEQLGERGRALGLAEHEHLLDAAAAGRLQGLVQERWDGQQEPRSGVAELAGQLVGGVEGADGGVDAAGGRDAVEGQGVLGQVGAVDGEHLALLEAPGGQAGRHPADPAGELAVGQGPTAGSVDQRRLVGPAHGVGEHVLVQGDVGDGDVGMGTEHDLACHGSLLTKVVNQTTRTSD
jgi:hypothetical protein